MRCHSAATSIAQKIQMEVLDADTLLLEYALGDKRSYLFAVTQDQSPDTNCPLAR